LKLLKTALLTATTFCPHAFAAADDQTTVRSETLLRTRTAWNGVRYEGYPKGSPELSVVKITIPPHSIMQWHTHPMPNAAYILSGKITVEEPNRKQKRTFFAGQAVPETVNTLHRGRTGDQPVVLIVFYAGVQGMPLAELQP
jgi:quercetin dioxygenase-like cupin family protein